MPTSSSTDLPIAVNTPWDKTDWKSIKVGYLASDRDDIEIGQGQLGVDNTGRNSVYYNMRSFRTPEEGAIIAKPFISGFDVASPKWKPVGLKM